MMNLYRWLQITTVLLPLLLSFFNIAVTSSEITQISRRCIGSGTDTGDHLAGELQTNPCHFCADMPPVSYGAVAPAPDAISVAFILLSTADLNYPMTLSAVLLNQGARVTILIAPDMSGRENEFIDRIFRFLPCDKHILAQSLLTIYTVKGEGSHKPACHESANVMCHVPDKNFVRQLGTAVNSSRLPDIILVQATGLAALLVTEHFRIPSIVMANDGAHLREMLGPPDRTSYMWTLRGFKYWIIELLYDRYWSLSWSASFVTLNMVRRNLGMTPLRTFSDVWNKAESLVVTSYPDAAGWGHPSLFKFAAPNLPPCLPCWIRKKWPEGISLIIVSTEDQGMTLEQARSTMQGFALARNSMRRFPNNCDWEDEAPGVDCWVGARDFVVIWLKTEVEMPIVVPDFVVIEDGSLLDTLALNPTAMSVIATLCRDDTRWIAGLGPPVLCLDQAASAHDLALDVLRLFRKPAEHVANPTEADGMLRTAAFIENLAQVSKRHSQEFRHSNTAADMGRILRKALAIADKRPYEAHVVSVLLFPFVLFIALMIFSFSVVYVVFEKLSPSNPSRLRRHRQYQRPTLRDIIDEITFRMPELEQAWDMWVDWTNAKLAYMQEIGPASYMRARTESKDPQHQTQSNRKRRPAKKRN